jgi:hypothetical protein
MSNHYDVDSAEANLIYDTLMKHYPAEIKKIQLRAANETATMGHVSQETERLMGELMDRVVADNKRFGRT